MANFSESDIREAFQTFDRDGNGFIGASDIHNTYLAMNENLNDDEVIFWVLSASAFVSFSWPSRCWQVDELIRMVDKDGDGQVSYEEFRKMVHDFNKKAGGKWSASLVVSQVAPPFVERLPPKTCSCAIVRVTDVFLWQTPGLLCFICPIYAASLATQCLLSSGCWCLRVLFGAFLACFHLDTGTFTLTPFWNSCTR